MLLCRIIYWKVFSWNRWNIYILKRSTYTRNISKFIMWWQFLSSCGHIPVKLIEFFGGFTSMNLQERELWLPNNDENQITLPKKFNTVKYRLLKWNAKQEWTKSMKEMKIHSAILKLTTNSASLLSFEIWWVISFVSVKIHSDWNFCLRLKENHRTVFTLTNEYVFEAY